MQESMVPLSPEQRVEATTQPVYPFQIQFLTIRFGGYQAAQAESLVATVFATQVFKIHAVAVTAPKTLLHGPSDPVIYKQVTWVPVYSEQNAVDSKHPAPFVKHPYLYEAHRALVVDVIGAKIQSLEAHPEVIFIIHPLIQVSLH